MPRLAWDKARILKALKQLHRAGKDLSYNALARTQQSLVSASAYHFGSYRQAVEKAGIDYADVTRRPRWTKAAIIKLIKEARRKGEDLHWAAVTKRRDELGKAAFASLQPRLFGRWDRALQGAGLDAAEVSQYRRWDKNTVTADLRERLREGEALNSGSIQKEDPGLHAAAVRHFGNYDSALRAAKIEPARVRQRQRWDRDEVLRQLREMDKREAEKAEKATGKAPDLSAGKASPSPAPSPSSPERSSRGRGRTAGKGEGKAESRVNGEAAPPDALIRRQHAALYSAAVRLFGSLAAARAAAKRK